MVLDLYDLGRSLRLLRENAKMTQEQLAKAIGISRSSLNNYENNFRRPSFETLESYADYFHTDMNSEGQHKLLDYALLLCNSGEYSKKDSSIELHA